ncbi:MAG: glucose-1-phosphate cytidylyltransferase [Anaerolineaceae bacterium]|nr:glucose-1-phosphate cytidylyltransferase [Anaerolineaceae bacterium]
MKVVLFCGGFGTRLKEYSETIPKPMVEIGYRPIMWHIMRYYAHYGHKDFILCLGYRGDIIKNYFINYNECLSNDFVMSQGGKEIHLFKSDIEDWNITFVDTGLNANIGQRLMSVRKHLEGEEMFLANYADGLADLDLDHYMEDFYQSGKTASFLCVQPPQSFHVISLADDGQVQSIAPIGQTNLWINGGFFAFKNTIFDNINWGEELVHEPFNRLIAKNDLHAYRHPGFWACMDTLKEKKMFDDMYTRGDTPWAIWENGSRADPNRVEASSQAYNGGNRISMLSQSNPST